MESREGFQQKCLIDWSSYSSGDGEDTEKINIKYVQRASGVGVCVQNSFNPMRWYYYYLHLIHENTVSVRV